jgi:KDO2-lipid IV(A) lauroyltransferase
MLAYVLKPLAWMPLSWLQATGALLGRLVYCSSRAYSARLDQNLRQSGLFSREDDYRRLRRAAAAAAGKTALESLVIWLSSPNRITGWIREVLGLASIEEARAAGRGILLLTPHLGCFEIAGFYFGQTMPLTILYRPPRARWLEGLMVAGRARGQAKLATTDLRGVRRLLKALRRGEAVGMLPDQAPRFGEGAWAPFFGRAAFTMTLAARLQQTTGCAAFMVFAERLPRAGGFRLHIESLEAGIENEAALNRAVERMIALAPEQYLWGYNRYKAPADAPPAPAPQDSAVPRRELNP